MGGSGSDPAAVLTSVDLRRRPQTCALLPQEDLISGREGGREARRGAPRSISH